MIARMNLENVADNDDYEIRYMLKAIDLVGFG